MRRPFQILVALAIPLLGCRPPAIPPLATRAEYTLYNAWLEQNSSTLPPSIAIAVDAQTLALDQNELQFQQCLPRRMQGLLSGAPAVALTSTSGNEWLRLSDGRHTLLRRPDTSIVFSQPTEWVRLSRVAFTLSGYDAYLWVEHRSCGIAGKGCDEGSGTLIHGTRSAGLWSFEDTQCQIITPPTPS